MSPQDPQNDPPANQESPDDPLTQAGTDATANFWYDQAATSAVACDSVPPPTIVSQDKQHWVEIALLDEDGNPVPDEKYAITIPGGAVLRGTLNSKGRARVNGINPGTCKITFPEYHQDAWKPR